MKIRVNPQNPRRPRSHYSYEGRSRTNALNISTFSTTPLMPISIEQLSPLYEAVQSGEIFPDSKFFTDCTPKSTPEDILADYESAHAQPGFNLKDFVAAHFEFPNDPATGYDSANRPLLEHLNELWTVLQRGPDEVQESTLIPLPGRYIVPGGRFREVYYWDSYFTMLGLKASGRVDLIEDMVDNFAWLIDELGFIPNGNRTYYLGRSQPPFFALMVQVLASVKGEAVLLHYRPQLEKEYAFWMEGENRLDDTHTAHRRVVRMPDGTVLNRYWDDRDTPRPEAYAEDVHVAEQSGREASTVYRHIRAAAESGWDFSSRWFADGRTMETIQTTDLIPVDLNCLLYFLEKTLLQIHRLLPDRTATDIFKEKARMRKYAIQTYCWDETDGFYKDYNHVTGSKSQAWTLAAVFPLFFQIAGNEQAAQVADHLEEKFLHIGGLATTLVRSGQQWDAPNGWAPLQWMAYQGLRNYAHSTQAEVIRWNWQDINEKIYAETGKMMEKYNVMDAGLKAGGGEYPNQDGFGWTNGVYLAMENSGK
jgi:alpha,alpha-trehalase